MTANHRFVILIVAAILALPEAAMPCSIPYMDYRCFVSEGLLPANVNGALFVWSITGYPVVIGGRRDGNVYLITVMPRLSPDSFRIVDKTRGKVVPARLQSADSSANGPTSSVYYLATDPTLKRCVQQPMGYEKSCFELRNPSRLIAQGRLVNVSARVNAHQGRFWITPKHGFIPGHVYELEYRSQAARAVWRYPHSTEVSISEKQRGQVHLIPMF